MKTRLYLFILLLFTTFAQAATLGYNGWLYSGSDFSFDGINYKTLISKGGTSFLFIADNSINLELNSCQVKEFRKFCYNSSFYDSSLKEYKSLINIYYLKPDVRITRTVSDANLEVGDISIITVKLENKGDEAANLEFSDVFPDNAEITSVDNADEIDGSIIWKGKLKPSEVRTITYKIKSKGSFDIYTKASVKYFDGIENKIILSEQKRIVSNAPLDFELGLDSKEYELNEYINLTIDITNNPEEKIPIEFELILPNNIAIVKKPLSFSANKYLGNIKNDTSYKFVLKAIDVGSFTIQLKGKYDYKKQYELDEKISFVVTNEGITPTFSLDTLNQVDSGKSVKIHIKLKNDNKYSELKNIRLGIKSDLGLVNTTLESIKLNQTLYLLNTEINAPIVEIDKTFPIVFNITYETQDGKRFSEKWSKNLYVKSIASLKIIIDSTSQAFENTPIAFKVKLQNPTKENIKKVFVKANIPKDFQVKGVSSATIGINASKTLEVLSFNVIPGYVTTDTDYNMTFSAQYSSEINESKIIKIKQKKPEVSFSRKLSSTSVYQGDIIDVTYTISSSDANDLHDLRIITSKSQNFDTLEKFEIDIAKLKAGEKLIMDGEQLRAKKKGTVEQAVLFFKDGKDRIFNISTSKGEVSVKESRIQENALYLELKQVNSTIEHKITNLGEEEVILDKVYYEDAVLGTNQFFYDYEVSGKKAKAYSNELKIVKIETKKTEAKTEEPVTKVPEQEEVKKKSIWQKAYDWFLGLFRR